MLTRGSRFRVFRGLYDDMHDGSNCTILVTDVLNYLKSTAGSLTGAEYEFFQRRSHI